MTKYCFAFYVDYTWIYKSTCPRLSVRCHCIDMASVMLLDTVNKPEIVSPFISHEIVTMTWSIMQTIIIVYYPRWLQPLLGWAVQYTPRNMHTVFALLCFVVVIHWLIFPYPSGLLHWHYGNLTIAPVPAKQPWWIWINTSCEFIMNDYITTTKQSTTKPCAYFLGYTEHELAWLWVV